VKHRVRELLQVEAIREAISDRKDLHRAAGKRVLQHAVVYPQLFRWQVTGVGDQPGRRRRVSRQTFNPRVYVVAIGPSCTRLMRRRSFRQNAKVVPAPMMGRGPGTAIRMAMPVVLTVETPEIVLG
jgi:hypothetical protein